MIFTQFAAIDWSGAKGDKHPGIAVALLRADEPAPQLVQPAHGRYWSRSSVAEWVIEQAAISPTLFGFDFSFAPPYCDTLAYLPGTNEIPTEARPFWAYVDSRCDDVDLGAASFLEQLHRTHFYFGAADGPKADFMRWRVCEQTHNANGGQKTSTVFDAIGASQVAKSSFAGMRVLHHIGQHVPVWPFDGLPASSESLVVEIYTSIAARAAGLPKGRSKVRDIQSLRIAMDGLGAQCPADLTEIDDHRADALMTAAWLRANAQNANFWTPTGLTEKIARTEGWTFGVSMPKGTSGPA